ncbi:hypothetical protein ACFL4G_05505, partial [Thermodesulfobacteriota bacterium]
MIHKYEINGLTLQTGDIICTVDGGDNVLGGEFWRLIGKMIPGKVDHIVIYVGPEGRCVEAGAKCRVIEFETKGPVWDAKKMKRQRGLIDTLWGVAYPLKGQNLSDL